MTGTGPPAFRRVFDCIVLFSSLFLFSLCATPVSAASDPGNKEKPYALIFGTVWGPDDRPVYGVRVLVRRSDKHKPQWTLYSNHLGEFAQRVPAGRADYIVWADLNGYKSLDGGKLSPGDPATVHVEYDERVDTGLHLK